MKNIDDIKKIVFIKNNEGSFSLRIVKNNFYWYKNLNEIHIFY